MPIVSGNDYEQDPVAWASAAQRDIERLFQLIQDGTNDGNARAYSGQEDATELRPQPFYPADWDIDRVGGSGGGGGGGTTGNRGGVSRYSTASVLVLVDAVYTGFDAGYDPNGWWDATNHRFTPTVAGDYLITVGMNISLDAGGDLSARLRKSGFEIGQKISAVNNNAAGCIVSGSMTAVFAMNGSTHYVDVYMRYGGGNPSAVTGTTFSAVLIDE